MTENESSDSREPTSPEPTSSQPKRRRGRGRRWWLFGLPIAALAGLFAARAYANGLRGGCGNLDELSADQLGERRAHMVEMAARFIDATPQQKTRLSALAKELTPQFIALRKEGKALRDKAQQAVRDDNRNALEGVRQQGLALAERTSEQWLAAYGKLADILTPEQRAELADHLQHHRHAHGGWH
jgi:periplasmic protein CpxP/Spy